MTARLDRLERSGLIRRFADPADGRAVRVRLTTRGVKVARDSLRAVIAADARFMEPLAEKQRDAAASILKALLLHYES